MKKYKITAIILIIVSLFSFSSCRLSYEENPNEELTSSVNSVSTAESASVSEESEESEIEFVSEDFLEETISLPFIPFE